MARKFIADLVGASRRKVRTFQGELRQKTQKFTAIGLMGSTPRWLTYGRRKNHGKKE